MAVAVPLISLLSLVAFTVYLLLLNPLLALVSFAIYPFALFVLPVLQRRANQENKKRVDASREYSVKSPKPFQGFMKFRAMPPIGSKAANLIQWPTN
jgi:ABC-type multidrug transport system fused ATPase/permease subunit